VDAVHLLDPANPAMDLRLPLEPGEALVDGLPQGRVAVRKGGTLFLADYSESRRRNLAQFDLGDRGTVAAVSPSGERFLLLDARGLLPLSPLGPKMQSIERIAGAFSPNARFRMGERFAAAADEGVLSVWDLRTSTLIYKTSIPAKGVGTLALLEEAGLAAVGGWFDEVVVADFKAGRTETVVLPGQTFSLRFIADAPSLLIPKGDTVHLWRPGAGIVAAFNAGGARFADARLTGAGLLALDAAGHHLHRLAYPGFPIDRAIPTGGSELWALSATDDGTVLFAGGSDGKLYAIDPGIGTVTPHELHTQGITALLCREDILASASDDKTIALRKLPSLEVFWRSQAHEYLINALHFSPSTRTLWSSSSDGKLKSWRWPQLAEVGEIVTGAGNHAALWVNADETLILAGTWKRMLVVLEKAGGAWKAAQVFRLPCQSVYSMAFLPGGDAVIMTGTEPGAVFIYDLKARSFHRLPDLGLQACWATSISPTEAVVAGTGGLLRYSIERKGAQAGVSAALAVNPRVGTIGTACLLKGGVLAMGTATGEVLFTDLASIPFKDLARAPLDEPIPPALTGAALPFTLAP
jgi:WD40 repeat protein